MNFQEIMSEITQICKKNHVKELYLFGSYATGTATDTSDIDIVVKGVPDIGKLREQLEKIRTLKKIDVFEFEQCRNKYLLEAIEQDARKIYKEI